ncbi:hypothetical protein L1N85_19465 [Paenibacillus alkaliterrae]|uniref:hypothetical protein n=1 Tax=Paenibacillus alkaliterrae TaxID=320909 RepID=UPI001F1B50B5|nr:hypothetical protein [Paenibacillus alkaliterrae]MCF2940575.1 hypothetical protein [Paenibacillus alkaliterrae]
MQEIMERLRKRSGNQKGITDMLVLLILLPTFLCVTLMVIIFATFLLRQAKIDDIKARALQMAQTEGYLTTTIINDTRTKLSIIGFPTVTKEGVTYPSFTGSTTTKVLKDDADPTVRLVIQYPASDLSRLMAFFGVTTVEDPGYYYLEANGRSEKYD